MTYYAMVRGNVVVQVVRMDSPPNGAGYDLVEDTQGVKCEPNWTRSGVRQYSPPGPTTEQSIDADILSAFQAMKDYRALATPTAAQRIAWEDLVATTLIRLGRKVLGRFDAAD
jgi:hypothetical protein